MMYYSFIFALQVELIVNPSDEVIPKLHSEYHLERLDFVFMDHWKKCYAPDLQVTRVGGKIINNKYKVFLFRGLI